MSKDNEVLKILKSGNEELVQKVIFDLRQSSYAKVKSFVLRNGGGSEDAEDVFQEGLIALYENVILDKFKGNSSIKTYLISICKNKWFSALKKYKKTSNLSMKEKIEPEPIEIDTALVTSVLDRISEDCRRVLIEFYFRGASMSKIKEIFQLSNEQVAKNKKHLCMRKVMNVIKEFNLNIENFIK